MKLKTYFVILMAGAVLFAGCLQPTTPPVRPDVNYTGTTPPLTENIHPLHQHYLFEQWAEKNGRSVQEARAFFLNNYGLQNEAEIYAALPAPREQFEIDLNTFEKGTGIEIANIPMESYLQPEFYPTFSTSGLDTWINAAGPKQSTVGYAATPAEQEAVIAADVNEFETTLFVGSGWGVTYYQGMAFRYTITPAAPITLEFSPNSFLMGPTFPAFDAGWVHPVRITGRIHQPLAAGTYTINIYPADPSEEDQLNWISAHSPYTNANSIFGPSGGMATLTLRV